MRRAPYRRCKAERSGLRLHVEQGSLRSVSSVFASTPEVSCGLSDSVTLLSKLFEVLGTGLYGIQMLGHKLGEPEVRSASVWTSSTPTCMPFQNSD